MNLFLNIICIGFLCLIVYQDFKERQISWFSLPALFICFLIKTFLQNYAADSIHSLLFNLSFIIIQLVLLTLWMSFRAGKFVNIIDVHLGLGDVLFFVAIAPAFQPPGFILFYLLSLLVTLIGALISKTFSKKEAREIPLAGAMSILLGLNLLIEYSQQTHLLSSF